jgi:hypothetical protein
MLLRGKHGVVCSKEVIYWLFCNVFLEQKAVCMGSYRRESASDWELQRSLRAPAPLLAVRKYFLVFLLLFWALKAWRERVEQAAVTLHRIELPAFPRFRVSVLA